MWRLIFCQLITSSGWEVLLQKGTLHIQSLSTHFLGSCCPLLVCMPFEASNSPLSFSSISCSNRTHTCLHDCVGGSIFADGISTNICCISDSPNHEYSGDGIWRQPLCHNGDGFTSRFCHGHKIAQGRLPGYPTRGQWWWYLMQLNFKTNLQWLMGWVYM